MWEHSTCWEDKILGLGPLLPCGTSDLSVAEHSYSLGDLLSLLLSHISLCLGAILLVQLSDCNEESVRGANLQFETVYCYKSRALLWEEIVCKIWAHFL